MTNPLETRLAQAHAQAGEPHARLEELLCALEGASWAMLLDSEEALAAQLSALTGPGLIRTDPRLPLPRDLYAQFGLALSSSEGQWHGARAAWLLEPDERVLNRARRADLPVIVDATLAPGGHWLDQGAEAVVYRDAVTLTGFGDVSLSVLLGLGPVPRRVAAPPADLAVALALRDLSTLALRMNRRSRNGERILERFGRAALPVSGGVMLLEHVSASTVTRLGGNLSAARVVSAGTLVTVGIESVDDAWAVLGDLGGMAPLPDEAPAPAAPSQERARPQPERESASAAAPAPVREAREERRPDPQPTPLPQRETPPMAEAEPVVAPAAAERVEATPTSAPTSGQDYSDREFVFSPLPVVAPAAEPAPAPAASTAAPTPEPAGRRGRRGRVVRPDAPTPVVQPEIVISDSQPADQWPEEQGGAATPELTGPPTPDVAPDPEPMPPPDLPPEGSADPTADLTEQQQAIFARLREWRNAEAKRQAVSRFIIASNATLAEIARQVPYTEADLKAVKGMGPERLRRYGEKLLEVVRG
ncbi:HRDC domain-containing protein [Deinococcus sonorensis]|uniref:HRDC domain-containing protein n=2 Tax=Deinococcus sonorensis TaxID=309891 RepID=A0AAU7U7L0_9DEIO